MAKAITHKIKATTAHYTYWKIDLFNPNAEGTGFSICVRSADDSEDSIIDTCIKHGILDKEDVEDFTTLATDITDDEYEMSFWEKEAQNIPESR